MTTQDQSRGLRLPRALLLLGCAPMVASHGILSLVMIFPLLSLLGGDCRQAILLIWWAFGTAGLGALVHASLTFRSGQRVTRWQVAGLLTGILTSLPLVFGFAGDWKIGSSAFLASCTASYILINSGHPAD